MSDFTALRAKPIETYRIEWTAPTYPPGAAVVPLRFFTSDNGFTSRDASAVADLGVGTDVAVDVDVRVLRLS